MNRIRKGMLTLVLSVVLTLGVFALEGEYKNNLLKVDFAKTGEGNYLVNLFTQKPYNSAVKVIKKSDTSYYILLPETYHSITSTPVGDDIKNVEIKLYPYAGQDINNGYTKINITTLKPVNFSTGIKTASGAGAPKVDFDKLAKLDSIFAEAPKAPIRVPAAAPVAVKPPVATAPAAPKVAAVAPIVKPPVVPVANTAIQPQRTEPRQIVNVQVPKADVAQKTAPVKDLAKVASSTQTSKTVVIDVEEEAPRNVAPVSTRRTVETIDSAPISSIDSVPTDDIAPMDLEDMNAEGEDIASVDDETAQQDFVMAGEEVQPLEEDSLLTRVKSKLRPLYHFALDNAALILGAGLISLLLLFVLIRRAMKPLASVGIPSQAEILQGEPLEGEIVRGPFGRQEDVETPTIITAEEFMDLSPTDFVHGTAQSGVVAESKSTVLPEEESVSDDEAQILSFVEIEKGRGFYLARFDCQVSLLGYIGEELFVIHQFEQEPQDMRIMHRLSEKSNEGTFYLVRVDDVKMLVRSTPEALSLELLM